MQTTNGHGHPAGPPGLAEPVPRELERGLRALVFELAGLGRARLSPTLSVGVPGGRRVVLDLAALPGPLDHDLRVELVAALLRRSPTRVAEIPGATACWLTRAGTTSWHDLDADWLAPAVGAFGEAGVPLTWVVVTRQAWWDPRSDVTRRWIRPRRR